VIPINNIYYLLCYAWNRLDEAELINIGRENINSPQDLFARVLVVGTNRILKKGLHRDYLEFAEEASSLKAKIDFSLSISKLLFEQAKAAIVSDELSQNVVLNQILKTTINNLSKVENLNTELRRDLKKILMQLNGIDLINLNANLFRNIQLHNSNSFYSFLLNICELVYQYLIPNNLEGAYKMRDFTRDEEKMSRVFQDFTKNFYKIHLTHFKVYSEQLRWTASGDESTIKMLPSMFTDVTLESSSRKIILDTKYYKEAFNIRFEKATFLSNNLYQLNAYLDSSFVNGDQKLEGILLYPATINEFTYSFNLRGFLIKIAAVDLRKSPIEIHQRMLEVLND